MNERRQERRKGNDSWIYFSRFLAIGGWLLFIVASVLSYHAAPEKSYGLYRYHNIEVREYWLASLTPYLYMVLWGSALASLVSLTITKYRTRRATDDRYYNMLLLLLVVLAWLVYVFTDINF
jgi:hypothetical protein